MFSFVLKAWISVTRLPRAYKISCINGNLRLRRVNLDGKFSITV